MVTKRGDSLQCGQILGLERIHQVTNTIRIAIQGGEYEYVFANTVIRLFPRAYARVNKKFYSAEVLFGKYMWVTLYIIKTETPIKTCNVLLAWEPPFKKI